MKKIKIFLYFPPAQTEKPITYYLIKKYDIMINILNAEIKQNKAGKLTADFEGTEENIEKSLKFLEEQGVEYKIFSKNIIWYEDKCIHCGACTGVCPTRALTLNPEDWSLTFNSEKCLICEQCLKVCPIKAMYLNNIL